MKNPFQLTRSIFVLVFVLCAAARVSGEIDDDGDSLSDIWSALYGGGFLPNDDSDDDGFTNSEEAASGTDPYDGGSFPKIDELMFLSPEVVTPCWRSVLGVHYQTLASGNLIDWIPVGPVVVGTGEVIALDMDPATSFATGGVPRSIWEENLSLTKLKGYVEAGTPGPSSTDQIRELRVRQSSPDRDGYGQWVRGYILPPETGGYIFYVTGDDHVDFYLSASGPPEGKTRVAGVPGWTSPDEWDKFPADQVSQTITLTQNQAYYFEVFHREGGGGDHFHVAWKRPSMLMGERETIGGEYLSPTGVSLQDLQQGGERVFLKLAVSQQDGDGDGLSDYEEGVLGLDMSSPTSMPRVDDLVSARQTLASSNTISLGVSRSRAYEASQDAGEFVIFRAGGIEPLTVPYTLTGEAVMGVDYAPLSGTVRIPGGVRSVSIPVLPIADGVLENSEDVVMTIGSGHGFEVGNPRSASVTIDDAADVLYVANLRAMQGSDSGGSGTASVRKTGNDQEAKLGLTFSGLDRGMSSAEIYYSENGSSGPAVYQFPVGQSAGLAWNFAPAGGLTREGILSALDRGYLWVRVLSEGSLEPEIIGQLLVTPAWQTMPAVLDPPVAPSIANDDAEAGRFLTQASFGPTDAEIEIVKSVSYETYIDNQLALQPTYHLPMMQERVDAYTAAGEGAAGWQKPRNEAWWQHALAAPDQLRQRMAFALSQIVVISQYGGLDGEHEGTTRYYDMLVEHAFGNYRDLLEEVTLSPMMGRYLSMSRNKKPDAVTGHEPDENYAREIMQLFSVGLNLMHTDGSLVLDSEGLPIPTYTQNDTVELAHIFTGWGPHYDPDDPPVSSYNGQVLDARAQFNYGRDPLRKMSFLELYHDQEERTILGGVVIPAGADGPARLKAALDAIFNHQNVGPFLARQLIQKFVTANPSPGYIYRVASVFNDDGTGVRGNLGATIKAVLLDYEARTGTTYGSQSFGKPAEPLLRVSRMLRGLPILKPNEDVGDELFYMNTQYQLPEQAPLLSPSVFNFYQPVFSNPGPIAEAGLLSPEFQIFGETNALRQANYNYDLINHGLWLNALGAEGKYVRIDYEALAAIMNDPGGPGEDGFAGLVDYLEDRILHGRMSPELRQELVYTNSILPSSMGYTGEDGKRRIQAALYIILNSPEYFVQR